MALRRLSAPLLLLSALLAPGCSSATSELGTDGFQLTRISVPEGETSWQINRAIEFEFNEDIDFDSVNLNTIQIRRSDGSPATGTFTIKQARNPLTGELVSLDDVVVFQPTCPREADFSDAGFLPGGVEYEIRVVGLATGSSITLQSESGRSLKTGQVRNFQTPESLDPSVIFQDTAVGPPQPVVRGAAGISLDDEQATYLEIGGEGGERIYFEFDGVNNGTPDDPDPTFQQFVPIEGVPLNLYSLEASRIAVMLTVNQPVGPATSNVNADRLGIEFLDSAGDWQPVVSVVDLVANCTAAGSQIRIEPVGLLPPTTQLRVVIAPEFEDIRGDFNLLPVNDFARMVTTPVAGNQSADELKEDFVLGGTAFNSFEDTESAFASQRAAWGGGRLSAAFGFAGTGGPGGDFDFRLGVDENLQFDTVSQSMSNADNTETQIVTGGVLHVRNFTLEDESEMLVNGPNPLVIYATGDVTIRGTLSASGFAANNVQSLNLATVPQSGGIGAAGGGAGGTGSPLTSSSSPRGGIGEGAFGVKGLGGRGGESGYAGPDNRNFWRPGGGGAGVFGPNEGGALPNPNEPENGLVAQPGFNGFDSTHEGFDDVVPEPTGAFGAESGLIPPRGGQIGPSPFLDGNPDNDFWGVMLQAGFNHCDTMTLGEGPVIGELDRLWAGAGGGGGGDAIHGEEFPSPQFQDPSTMLTLNDYKGGGGGGGAGGIHILALGTIRFEGAGRILCNGGNGGTGESTLFIDRIGGGGGGGSGGHVVLESNTAVDFQLADGASNAVEARGGRGGLGLPTAENPEMTGEFEEIFTILGRRVNEGGRGGPGVIQIHVPGGTPDEQLANILLPGVGSCASDFTAPDALVLAPSFGSVSRAQSDWVSLGGASPASGATDQAPVFLFDGTDGLSFDEGMGQDNSSIGFIETAGNSVVELDPILSGTIGGVDGEAETVLIEGVGPGAGAANQISDVLYLRNPALLEGFGVVLERAGVQRQFDVVDATFQNGRLTLTVTGTGSVDTFGEGDAIDLVPRYFRVVTKVAGEDRFDILPVGQSVQIQFQATGLATDGGPNTDTVLVPATGDANDWTGNIEDLNGDFAATPIAFFRFSVVFDTGGVSPNTPLPTLDFLRMPFEFFGPTEE